MANRQQGGKSEKHSAQGRGRRYQGRYNGDDVDDSDVMVFYLLVYICLYFIFHILSLMVII